MSNKKDVNCAEAIDRMNKGVAWGMLICGMTYFITAMEKIVDPGRLNSALDVAGGIGVALTLIVTLLAMWPVIKMKIGSKSLIAKEPESFMSDAMHASFKNSWIVSMMFLTVLLALQNKLDELNLPISFYLIATFGFLATSASVSFFLLTRNDGTDDLEGE